jgi:hypothetical protein
VEKFIRDIYLIFVITITMIKKTKIKKKRIWVYLDEQILKWIYGKMNEKIYANESHCFESLVMEKVKTEKNKK